jgi:hypothetical protein
MREPSRDANIASMLALIKQGKSKRAICAELDISKDTFEDYQKEYLTDAVGRLTMEEGDFLLRRELKRCDDLEEKTETGIMKCEKKVQLLLQIATHRCKLLGLFPQQPLIELNPGGQNYPPVTINFTVVGRDGNKRVINLPEERARRSVLELPAAPDQSDKEPR